MQTYSLVALLVGFIAISLTLWYAVHRARKNIDKLSSRK